MSSPRNPHKSEREAIKVPQKVVGSALLTSGFRVFTTFSVSLVKWASYLPCPVGTFYNVSSQEAGVCTSCPPGIL